MIPLYFKAFYYEADESNTYSSHFHNSYEFILPESGYSLQTEFGVFTVSPGTMIFLQANTLHNQVLDNPPCSRYVLHIGSDTVNGLSTKRTDITERLKAVDCLLNISSNEGELKKTLKDLVAATSSEDKNDLKTVIALLHFFDLLLACVESEPCGVEYAEQQGIAHQGILLVHRAQKYIQQNLSAAMSIDSIASELFISKFYLSHLFKQVTGYSIMEYVSLCRLENACELLRKGASVEEARLACNIQDSGYFSRVFKKHYGISPSAYRNKYNQKISPTPFGN